MPLVPLAPFKAPRRSAAAQTLQVFNIPAPVGGLNYRDPISDMRPTDALVLTNLIPRQTGVELRKGWTYHTSSVGSSVDSIFAYNGAVIGDNKLFAAAGGNIYDVTSGTPSVAVSATGSTNDVWSVTQFANGAGMYLLAVSPGAGYWTYDGTTWTQQTVTGLPGSPETVAVFKNRVWFTVSDSSTVYYLDTVDAIAGTASGFEMGSLLRNGGYIRGLVNWTLDAGVGIDDHLVVVGSQGDIGVWTGTDPSDPSKFALRGVWYVGKVPKFGRFFTGYGGEVMMLSELGLVPVSRLVNGQFSDVSPGPAQKIQSVLIPLVRSYINSISWDVFLLPSEDILIIKLPEQVTGTYQQFAMNVNTGAWCDFSGMPMTCAALLDGQLYFGTEDGRIAKGFLGNTDGTETNGTPGATLEGDVQTAFNSFNTPAVLKKFTMARPIFIAPGPPSVKLQINTQYTFVNVGGSPSFVQTPGGIWNSGLWNVAVWAGSANTYQSWAGTTGLGYYASLRMKVRGLPATIFTSSHMMSEPGGVM
jgi:hypothetical protein